MTWHQRYVTQQRSAANRQPWGWPVLPWPMDSPLIPFFCGEREAGKVGAGSCGWYYGGQGRVEGLLANEEL